MIHDMVTHKEDIPNAFALNSSMVNIARLVGPALSGIILLKYGAGICFLLNAVSFVAVITSLVLMKLPAYVPSIIKKKIGNELAEGFAYLANTPSIGVIIIMLCLISLLVYPFNTLLPVFAKVIYRGDAATFGYINSFIGLGAVAGSIMLASLKKGTDLKIVLLYTSIVFGVFLILFSQISYFPLAMLFATLTGFGMMAQTTVCMTIVQVESAKDMRGRVMSYVAFGYFGMLPLGSLLVGWVSQKFGAPNSLLWQGIIMLIIVVVFRKFLRADKLNKKEKEELELA
jgi:predicted MFS family arabinose efflux permease